MRKREPERTLVVGSNDFQDVSTFPELRVPTGDPAMLLSFHFYKPMLITHYRARWAKFLKDYDGPIAYPGRVLPPDRLDSFPDEYRDVVETQGGEWDRGRIDREVAVAQDRANELGYPCYCGEFGVRTVVPPELRLAWYRDMVDVLKTRNIAYATWDWKGGFAVKDRKTDVLDRELADILTASS
jgi:endoglucanase